MSSERDDDKTVITDNNIPVNSAGDPITYMGNPATIPGLVYQIEEWSAETQRFHLLLDKLKDILHDNEAQEIIDSYTMETPNGALLVDNQATETLTRLEALAARLEAVPDPFRGSEGGGRGGRGKVTKWSESLGTCRWCQGKHLNKDCRSEAAKKFYAAKEAEAAAKAAAKGESEGGNKTGRDYSTPPSPASRPPGLEAAAGYQPTADPASTGDLHFGFATSQVCGRNCRCATSRAATDGTSRSCARTTTSRTSSPSRCSPRSSTRCGA